MIFSAGDMDTLDLVVSFDSPTFTHGADKATVEARPTEFKAELRRWYRILKALKAAQGKDVNTIRTEEQNLFGGTNNASMRSKVLIRSKGCPKDLSVKEVFGDRSLVDVFYLAYGIADSAQEFRGAKCLFSWSNHGGNSGDERFWRLRLTVPSQHRDDVKESLWMLDRFGCIGGRSNSGWGSLSVKLDGANELPKPDFNGLSQELDGCLQEGWPHWFGQDGKDLMIWRQSQSSNLYSMYKKFSELRRCLNDKGKIADGKRGATQVHFKVKKSGDVFQAMAYCMPYRHGGKSNLEGVISSWAKAIDEDGNWNRFNPFTEGNFK
ncbi:MAG: hypothetical protein M1420_03520 [Actinobacteria bacterium]|nr:hypothetical protein [Actinomycetota bacterium]